MHKIIPAIAITILLMVAIVGYFFWQNNANLALNNEPIANTSVLIDSPVQEPPTPIAPPTQEPPVINTDPVLPIATPQEPNGTPTISNVVTPKTPIKPLPTLEESDAEIRTIAEQFGGLVPLIVWENFIRYFVVTIDNIPNRKLPRRYSFTKPLAGKFAVRLAQQDTETIALDRKNYQRYENFLNVLTAIELEQLIPHYQHFYSLFQQSYEELGYPNRRFHDRLLQVIDHLQETPEIQEPIYLIRPKVFYQFKDTELESLSAGQKIMLRIGTENRQKAKSKLKELRIALESLPL
ncbi:hypothetical protein SPBRAN_212 [uncultured Candidatus Thioglobus sp.]|nr:hypothetical protein SPBRAN_212 [uncultured Candidatus Thioglobus sp.]